MKKLFVFAAIALAALVSCNKDKEVTKDDNAAGDITKVCLNEVCGVVGYKGIELYNAGDKECSLEGVTIFKNGEEAACWTGTADDKIAAKGFFVIKGKKETTNIDAVANSVSTASFSPTKSLLLELKDAYGKVLSTFDRGWKANGNAEVTLAVTVEDSYALTTDGGTTWKLKAITIGASNNNAADKGDIPTAVAQ